jgi:hypothetical protein
MAANEEARLTEKHLPEMEGLPEDLQVFDRRAAPLLKQPFITRQASGTITANASAAEGIGYPEAVELLFSPKTGLMVVRPAEMSSPRAYKMRKQGRSSNYVVGGRAFWRHIGVGLGKGTAKRFMAEVRNGVLVIDLNQGTNATGPRDGELEAVSTSAWGQDEDAE